jgi:hypothetical protein
MTEEKPVQDAPKRAEVRPQPEKRSPIEWATPVKQVRAFVTPLGEKRSTVDRGYLAAARKHGWADAPGFKITKADYDAAVSAAKKFQQHIPALPGKGV